MNCNTTHYRANSSSVPGDPTENIDLVVDKATVAYVRGDLDLTDKAIQMYNSSSGSAPASGQGPTAPPAAPKK